MAVIEPIHAPGAAGTAARRRHTLAATSTRRLWTDRAARWVVTGGGLAIIASILGILVFILLEVIPLTRPARVAVGRTIPVERPIEAMLVDEYQSHVAALSPGGTVRVLRLSDGAVVVERSLAETLAAAAAAAPLPWRRLRPWSPRRFPPAAGRSPRPPRTAV